MARARVVAALVRGRACVVAPTVPRLSAMMTPAFTRQSAGMATEAAAAAGTAGEAAKPYTVEDVVMPEAQGVRFVWYKQADVPGSVKKVNIVARQIRGLSAAEAMAQMTFSVKRRAPTLRYAIQRAVRRAEDRYDLFAEDLVVHECTAEIQRQEQRLRFHARGRFGTAHLRKSRIRVVLREAFPEEKEALTKFTRAKARPVTKEMRSPRHY